MEQINKTNFTSKIQTGLSLVDFYAVWCGPCKMLAPFLEKAAEEFKNVNFYKVDIDESAELQKQYRITTVPTVILFKDGNPIGQFSGFLPINKIKEFITTNAK